MKKNKRMWSAFRLWVADRKIAEKEVGGFRYIFRKYSMEVRTLSGNFGVKVMCTEHPCGYLLQSMKQGKDKNLEGYATLMYIIGTNLTRDQNMVSDITQDVKNYFRRLEKKGKKAKDMTPEEEAATLYNERKIYDKGRD